MKLNIQKLVIILVTFSLTVGLLSQTSTSQASAELRLPDCIGIIPNCNNQDCSAESSNEVNDNNSISQSNQADSTQSAPDSVTQTSQNNSGAASGINTLADSLNNALSATLSTTATMSDDDQNTQTSSASTNCNYNNEG
jgi:hypothetical protein